MALTIDHRALGRGMATYLAIAAPCGLLIAVWHGSDKPGQESSVWVAAALAIIVVAPLVAGAVAGRDQRAPLIHGALAVVAPAGLFFALRAGAGGAQGTLTTLQVVRFVLYLVVFTSLGMLGGYLGFRRRQRVT